MRHPLSPGVERARAAAPDGTSRAWLLALLADDDGRPAERLRTLGLDPEAVRLAAAQAEFGDAQPDLLKHARPLAVELSADPTLTTDVVLLALLEVDEPFAVALGLSAEALRSLWPTPEPASAAFAPAAFLVEEAPDRSQAARILDANANRAREAYRVLDDYARFALNDAILTQSLKEQRHRLAASLGLLPANLLLAVRDTPGDVGTTLTAGGEYARTDARQVAAVNAKRLQEALRSLEEYGKLFSTHFAASIEQLRYAAYTLERALLRGDDARAKLADARLYVLLSGSRCAAALDWTIAEAADGGAQVVQLREKELPDRELLAQARNVRRWTRKHNVLFIVNDRPDIAKLAEADGVHLGQDDLPIAEARRILGAEALIGVSTHDVAQLREAVLAGADYVGVGPTFPSRTKNFEAFAGLELVAAVARATSLPAFALGGITPANVAQVIDAGLRRIAASDAIAAADDPRAVAATFRELLTAADRR